MNAIEESELMKGLFAAAAICLVAGVSFAQEDRIVGVHKERDWTVYQSEAGEMECGIVAKPRESVTTRNGELVSVSRGRIMLAVTIGQPGSSEADYRVSFQSGYPFRPNSTVTMRIGSRTFTLGIGVTEDDSEWAWPPADDDIIVGAMRSGMNAVLTAVSSRGTDTQDTFSLLGVTRALEIAEQRCNPGS